ncbi:cation transporter [Aquimarina sp. 433]
MKNLFFILFAVLFTSCGSNEEEEKRVLQIKEGDNTLVVNIPKAACKKCQKILEEGIFKESGVQQSILNLHTKNLSVVYTPEKTSPRILETTIERLAHKSLVNN